ncbi:MAG: acyl-CoA synthetase [Burkholderiales bacterium]
MSEAWLTQAERGNLSAMRLIIWVTLRLGRRAGRLLLYPICGYFMLFSLHARRASRDYLRRVLGRAALWREVFRHYLTFASIIHDRVYLLSGRQQYFDLKIHGLQALQAARAQGAGCILLGSHLGSFEILRAHGMLEKKLPINVLMHEDNASKINRALHALHPEIAARIIAPGQPQTLLRVKECLERGELVGMLGDRIFHSEKTLSCRFLGTPAVFPQGPLLLASILHTPVVLFFGLYRGGKRYDIHFEALDASGAESHPRAQLERYVQRLEHYCRLAPYNWFNFYDFWADAGKHCA